MRSLLINHSYLGTGDLFAPSRWLEKLLHRPRHIAHGQYRASS
ncbi:MAG: hypothetical protein ACLFV1_06925 [Thiohalophilus sp.]